MAKTLNNKSIQVNEEYYAVLKAIVLTGGLVLNRFRGTVQNNPKQSDLPQNLEDMTSTAHTIIDDLVQEIALEILLSHFPKIGINVEEDTERVKLFSSDKTKLCFHLDPLDGTLAYTQGRDDFSIGAAFSQNMRFIVCAIYLPAFDRLYYAERGRGIHISDLLGRFIQFQRKSTPRLLYCQKRCENLLPTIQKMNLEPLDCLSAHHKMIAVAEGNAAIQMCHLASPHDFGVASVILEEAGGVCSDLNANPIEYDEDFSRVPYFLAFYNEEMKQSFFQNF